MVKKIEKIDMYDFAVHECTPEQNGSPNFSSIVRQIDKLTETPFRGVAVKLIKKDCWDPGILQSWLTRRYTSLYCRARVLRLDFNRFSLAKESE